MGYEPRDPQQDEPVWFPELKTDEGMAVPRPDLGAFACPEGLAIQAGERADVFQLARDFGDHDPDDWTLRTQREYLALRKAGWVQ